MTRSPISNLAVVCSLAAAFVFAGCSTDTTTSGESTGSLDLNLELAPGVVINEVKWVISGPDMPDMDGTIDTSAPGATASVEVFGLPPGGGYTVTLTAMVEGEDTPCIGSADFSVEVGESTPVMVMLNCKRPERLGGVRVNGKFNVCAELAKVIVSPLQTSVGNEIDLSALAQDVDDDQEDIRYRWIATGGSIADPNDRITTYTCEEVGENHTIIIQVSDDEGEFGEFCMDDWDVDVTCVLGDEPECEINDHCGPLEICENNICVPDVDCEDDNDCDALEICNDKNECEAVECKTDDNCDFGLVCSVDNICVPDVDCTEHDDCDVGEVCIADTCVGDPDLFCDENLCDIDDDARADCIDTFVTCIIAEPADEEACIVFARLKCNECNEESDCDTGEVCNDDKVCVPAAVACEYDQDFEALTPGDPPQAQTTDLAADGWLVGANVFESDGTTLIYDYFAFAAPNGGPAFSAVAVGEGGAEQGAQQLSIYNDYANTDHGTGRIIEAIVFQDRTIIASDVGTTIVFTFDAKRGNIEGASTALAFIKTLDPDAGFATTNFITQDTTNLPDTWNTFTLSLPIDASLVGQLLQFGAQSRAANFEGSGVFYDNMTFGPEGCSGDNGGGGPTGELTTNGDFETGDFTGWTNFCDAGTCTVTTDNPNGGVYAGSVFIDTLAANAVIKQERIAAGEVATGDTIAVELFIRGSVGPGGVVFLELFSENTGGGVDNEGLRGPFFPTNDWVQISESFTLSGSPGDGITVQIAAITSGDTGSFVDLFVDDVSATNP